MSSGSIRCHGLFWSNSKGTYFWCVNERAAYWIGLSDYDLDTARAMLSTKRFLYVGFMCHQCIEKAIKAYHSEKLTQPPTYTHSLSSLARNAGLIDAMSTAQLELIDVLEPLNIEARYPSYKEKLLRSLSAERCSGLIGQTIELQKWIKERL